MDRNDVSDYIDPSGRDLSARIWRNRRQLEARLDRIIADGIANGDSIDVVADRLIRYVKPSYARNGTDGTARHAALRLVQNETRRARNIAARDVAVTDPAGGYLRYRTSPSHVHRDVCDSRANHQEGFGRGVYPARECPLPPEHVGCRCVAERVQSAARDINDVVDRLRVEYGLDEEPTDLSPRDLAIWRAETGKVRDGVQFLFRAWFEQTGLVTPAQLIETSPSVRQWVADVAAEKARGR